MTTSRRTFVQGAAATLAAAGSVAVAVAASEEKAVTNTAFDYQHAPAPLPFAAKALNGISEKLIQSHWQNNYTGAVTALNLVRGRLKQALGDANTPAYLYNGLKREQLLRTGSVVLHELYFGNLGGDGKAGADQRTRIAASFGSSTCGKRNSARSARVSVVGRAGLCSASIRNSSCSKTTGWPITPRHPQTPRQFW